MPTLVNDTTSDSARGRWIAGHALLASLAFGLWAIQPARLLADAPSSSQSPGRLSFDADPTPAVHPFSEKVASEYEGLFGDAEKRVAATPATRDDAAFAVQLMQKAGSLSDEPELLRLMYEKAYAYGAMDFDGYAAATEAVKQILAKDADPGWRARLIDLYRKQVRLAVGKQRADAGDSLITELLADARQLTADHRFGEVQRVCREAEDVASKIHSSRTDEVAALVKEAQSRQLVLDKITRLKSKLDQNPQDLKVRNQIIGIYLFELDDAADALKFVDAHADAATRDALPLAAKSPRDLTSQECLTLGAWLRSIAEKGEAPDALTRFLALGRAEACYQHYLDIHEMKDAERLMAEKAMDNVHAQQAKLETEVKLFFADSVVIYNTHNGSSNDRGATAVAVSLIRKGARVWTSGKLPIPWAAGADPKIEVPLPHLAFDRVRVDVLEWHGFGGGLTEVQIIRKNENLAAGAAVSASGALNRNCPPTNLIDGITNSATPIEKPPIGYWLLPPASPGWAEIAPTPGVVNRPSVPGGAG